MLFDPIELSEGEAMNQILLYIASAMTGLWGVAHLFATRGVVKGLDDLSFFPD
jgi:hypothetical protein